MTILSIAGIITSLSLLVYEDFRYRKISVLFIVTLLFSILLFNINSNISPITILTNTAINTAIISLNLAIITLYFSVKKGRLVNITRQQLGWGDIIFFIVTGFLFSPLNFLVFFLSSLFFSLLLIITLFNKPAFKVSIPLVGLQALALIILFIICLAYQIMPSNDDNLLKFLA